MSPPDDDDLLSASSFDTSMLTDAQWRVYFERRMDRQDRILRKIVLLLIVGKGGWAIIRWLGIAAVALIPALVALKAK